MLALRAFIVRAIAFFIVIVSFLFSALPATAGPDEAMKKKAVDEKLAAILAKLPGETAVAFSEIVDNKPTLLYGVRPAERMAVGSTFKLYILGALIDEVNHGRRRADNVMLLSADLIGPPSSELAEWPVGSPVTLHTLALKMISISDNTATDHLLYLLSRERVEAQMAVMGHGEPQVNRPLFSTREMTMLRDKKSGLPGKEYLKLDDAGRRAMLAKIDAQKPDYENLDFDTASYKVAEWYASPLDIANALAWIYEHTAKFQPAHELRAILTVENKLPLDRKVWPFVGFKGGSEDQILAGNWLLQNQNGHWYTFSFYCNNPTQKIDQEQVLKAMVETVKVIESTLKH